VKIAVLGTGNVGSALGSRWAEHGHEVSFGAKDPAHDPVGHLAQSGPHVRVGSCAEALAASEVVLLAIPWSQARLVLEQAGDLSGKILIDCINPLAPDLTGLELGYTTSAAEQLAAWFPKTRVVKAFNALSAAAMRDPMFGQQRATAFYCGDDADAKSVVRQLSQQLGFDPVDCGGLRLARQLEPLAMLYVHLAVFEGWGGDCAFKILKR